MEKKILILSIMIGPRERVQSGPGFSVEGGSPVLAGSLSVALVLGSRNEPGVWSESCRAPGASSCGASLGYEVADSHATYP